MLVSLPLADSHLYVPLGKESFGLAAFSSPPTLRSEELSFMLFQVPITLFFIDDEAALLIF